MAKNRVEIEVVADTQKAETGLGKLNSKFEALTGISIKSAISLAGLGTALRAAYSYSQEAVAAASDLNETISKTNVIFEDGAEAIEAWAETTAITLGQSKQQAMDAASTFAIFGKSAGLTGAELVDFSVTLSALASDLASFSNTTPEDAIIAMGAALRGESEPIRRYGVLLDDATLRQIALKKGMIETTKQALTPQQRALAAYQAILDQTTDAQGDFARTSDGLANQQRILEAQTNDLKAAIGVGLIPITIQATKALNEMVTAFTEDVYAINAVNQAKEMGLLTDKEMLIYSKKTVQLAQERIAEYETEIERLERLASTQRNDVAPSVEDTTRILNDHAETIEDVMADYADWDHQADLSTEKVKVSFSDMASEVNRSLASTVDEMFKDMQWIAAGGLELQAQYAAAIETLNKETLDGTKYAAANAVTALNEVQIKAQIMEDDINGIDTSKTAETISSTLGISLQAALDLVQRIRADAQFDITSYVRVVYYEEHGDERDRYKQDQRVGGEIGWDDEKAAGGMMSPGGSYLVGNEMVHMWPGGGGSVQPINNYNLTINSNARAEQVAASFALMKAMA